MQWCHFRSGWHAFRRRCELDRQSHDVPTHASQLPNDSEEALIAGRIQVSQSVGWTKKETSIRRTPEEEASLMMLNHTLSFFFLRMATEVYGHLPGGWVSSSTLCCSYYLLANWVWLMQLHSIVGCMESKPVRVVHSREFDKNGHLIIWQLLSLPPSATGNRGCDSVASMSRLRFADCSSAVRRVRESGIYRHT